MSEWEELRGGSGVRWALTGNFSHSVTLHQGKLSLRNSALLHEFYVTLRMGGRVGERARARKSGRVWIVHMYYILNECTFSTLFFIMNILLVYLLVFNAC